MFNIWKKYKKLEKENHLLKERIQRLTWQIEDYEIYEGLDNEAKYCLDLLEGKRERLVQGLLKDVMQDKREEENRNQVDGIMKKEMEKLIHETQKERIIDVQL